VRTPDAERRLVGAEQVDDDVRVRRRPGSGGSDEDVDQFRHGRRDAGLLVRLADRGLGRRLVRFDEPPGEVQAPVVGAPDEQDPTRLVEERRVTASAPTFAHACPTFAASRSRTARAGRSRGAPYRSLVRASSRS
jgi:hypothetical protein